MKDVENKPLVDLRQSGKFLEWIVQDFDGFQDMLAGKNPKPLQLEIHPYHISQGIPCTNQCLYCTGQAYRESFANGNVKGIEPERLIKTIRESKGYVKRILLSGNNTEPLLYPKIDNVLDEILNNNMGFFLYTNFYNGNDKIRNILVNGDSSSFVRVSIDAGSSDSYFNVHRPYDKESFEIVCNNVSELLKLRENRGSGLKVYLHYLLTEKNSSCKELDNITNWSFNTGVDVLQFGIPQKPLTLELKEGDYSAIMSSEHYDKMKDDLLNIKERYNGKIRIDLTKPLREQKEKKFERCHIQRIIGVIGYNGLLFPCTSVASEKFRHKAYGDINKEDIWDIWNSKSRLERLNFSLDDCPDCTKMEFNINHELSLVKDIKDLV